MEALIDIHGKEHIFIGALPTESLQYGKRFELTTGTSKTNFSRSNRRDDHVIISEKGPRGFPPQSVVSQIFHSRYCLAIPEPVLTLANVEKVLNHEIRIVRDGRGAYGIGESQAHHIDRLKSIVQFERTKMLTQTQLLTTLFVRINDESRELAFDYFSMHERCALFLRDIYAAFEGEIDKINDGPLGKIHGELLHVARFIFGALIREDTLYWNTAKVSEIMEPCTEKFRGNIKTLCILMALSEFKKDDVSRQTRSVDDGTISDNGWQSTDAEDENENEITSGSR